jgi:Helix-turn-helix domain
VIASVHRNPSQAQVILDHLLTGKQLTALEALAEYGCFRLAARVHELRKEGYDIEEQIVTRNGKRYASYFIRTFNLEYA